MRTKPSNQYIFPLAESLNVKETFILCVLTLECNIYFLLNDNSELCLLMQKDSVQSSVANNVPFVETHGNAEDKTS